MKKKDERKRMNCLKMPMILIMMLNDFDVKLYCFEFFDIFVIRRWTM